MTREPIKPIDSLLKKNITNKNIAITGAGGSIGKELSLQITDLNPKSITLIDHSEFALYEVLKEVSDKK